MADVGALGSVVAGVVGAVAGEVADVAVAVVAGGGTVARMRLRTRSIPVASAVRCAELS